MCNIRLPPPVRKQKYAKICSVHGNARATTCETQPGPRTKKNSAYELPWRHITGMRGRALINNYGGMRFHEYAPPPPSPPAVVCCRICCFSVPLRIVPQGLERCQQRNLAIRVELRLYPTGLESRASVGDSLPAIFSHQLGPTFVSECYAQVVARLVALLLQCMFCLVVCWSLFVAVECRFLCEMCVLLSM